MQHSIHCIAYQGVGKPLRTDACDCGAMAKELERLRQELAKYEAAANKNQVISLAMSKVKETNERLRQEVELWKDCTESNTPVVAATAIKRLERERDEAREVARRFFACGGPFMADTREVEIAAHPWLEE